MRTFFIALLTFFSICSFSQDLKNETFHSDSALTHASVSLCVADANTGEIAIDYNSGISLAPASVMKLITTAAALELLGPEYTFKTTLGYSGKLNKRFGTLKGNIIIHGGGDPALGSQYFSDHYGDFVKEWVSEIKKLGIKRIKGKIITDDSYYDYQPVPSKWLWEDEGNYYGAGAYGLSVYDNSYEVHVQTYYEGAPAIIKDIIPAECRVPLSNFLMSSGNTDEGYFYSAPYSTSGWVAGNVPVNQKDFILKASISDPPLLLAKVITERLKTVKIKVSGSPSTARADDKFKSEKIVPITETISPPLAEIVNVLNHESVNLFAEHLIKELGKKFKNNGTTAAGSAVITEFLENSGININGIFIEDGSGLSPIDAVNTRELVRLLIFMKNKGKNFNEFYSSLPDAGKNGTLKNYFKDPVFADRLKAKSGTMTRVRSFAGYFTTRSGKNMVFSIIINNYSGPLKVITAGIEENIKELILNY
jgi:D-alanyl-D-alanine carboxypeptidase/D-alanyl-D-alanine-endopeptidase (penicillin-binding protein 4)